MIGIYLHNFRHLDYGHVGAVLQEAEQVALVLGGEVHDDDKGQPAVAGRGIKKVEDRLKNWYK